MEQKKSTLETIAKLSYPSSSLLIIDIIREFKDGKSGNSIKKIIAMLSIIPGVKQDNSEYRTFDVNQRVSMKLAISDLIALSKVLRSELSVDINNYNFSKFTRSNSGMKIINITQKIEEDKDSSKKKKTVYLSISHNKAKYGLKLEAYDAYALGELIYELASKSFNELFEPNNYQKDEYQKQNKPTNEEESDQPDVFSEMKSKVDTFSESLFDD